ncbi:MAG: FtsX-like permease family protein [Rhodanobacter sp.]|nr:MAG: FtsX-like permease family protein [Rhodanobacter sp.]
MQIRLILAALRQHRAATVLVVLQIALTLAIVCNALFIIQLRLAHIARPTGIDEAHIVVIQNQWIGKHETAQLSARLATDLAALRQLPGVADAYADYTYPVAGPWAALLRIGLKPDQRAPTSFAEGYQADDHTLSTLGLQLVAGRNFRPDEIVAGSVDDALAPPVIIVTRDLAERLFAHESAVRKRVYISDKPSTIIGVVRHLEVPAVGTHSFAYCSVLLPSWPAWPYGNFYVLRAKPGQLDAVMRAAPKALLAINRMRVMEGGAKRYSDLRAAVYADDRGVTLLMSMICVVLLLATVGGIGGLTSFWVGQRRRQIGIRRALGATRGDILRYFQTENFLIVSGGIALGLLLAVVLNLFLMKHYELRRLPLSYLPISALVLWLLGQLAVLGPALRAAAVPPVVVTRSV